ncbi:MAG: MBL fold metallo-hydrolase [Bacteroidia bacterium]|nr:MBL fold metallo-hydrolase [Bacteroidia bacterium]
MSAYVSFQLFSSGYCTAPDWFMAAGGTLRRVRVPAAWALIRHPQEGPILLDTGYGMQFQALTRRWPARFLRYATPMTLLPEQTAARKLGQLGIRPEDIRHILLTHLHTDHSGGLRSFPAARIWCSEAAIEYFRSHSEREAAAKGVLKGDFPDDFLERALPVEQCPADAWEDWPQAYDLFGDGSIRMLPLPGHARGQMGAVLRTDTEGEVLLAADACWVSRSYRSLRMPFPLARLVMDDPAAFRRSLEQLHALHRRRPELPILPCHCPEVFEARIGAY